MSDMKINMPRMNAPNADDSPTICQIEPETMITISNLPSVFVLRPVGAVAFNSVGPQPDHSILVGGGREHQQKQGNFRPPGGVLHSSGR